MKKQSFKTKIPEWLTAEEDFEKTQDYRFVALVIGKWPKKPPLWAIEACVSLYKEVEISPKPILRPSKGGPKLSPADSKMLERIAKLMSWMDCTFNYAANLLVSDDDHKQTNTRRLGRLWKGEELRTTLGEDEIEIRHPRLERAIIKRMRRRGLDTTSKP